MGSGLISGLIWGAFIAICAVALLSLGMPLPDRTLTDQPAPQAEPVGITPEPEPGNVFTDVLPVFKTPPRADALLFVESKGRVEAVESADATARRNGPTYHGRY